MTGIHCAFIATLSKDPSELKQGKSGQFCNFSCTVPCDAGEPQWLNVITFGSTAEAIARDTKKGDRVFVEGAIRLASWQDGEGQQKFGLAVSATKVERLFKAISSALKFEEAAPDATNDTPKLPIALPVRKRPVFARFRRKKKEAAQGSAEVLHERPFDDPLSF